MRDFGEIRLIVFKRGAFNIKTEPIVVSDWPMWEDHGWRILAIDPEDELAYSYWTHQGHPELHTLI